AWGVNGTNARPGELIEGIPNILDFISRLFPPRFDMTDLTLVTSPFTVLGFAVPSFGFPNLTIPFPEVMFSIIETIQMALIGSVLGIFLAAPFGLLAARNTSPHPWIYQGTRMLLNANRALPEIVFALVFVAAVGLGPFGGVLALAIGSVGSIGKLYAEAIESIDPQQVLAIRATGANRLLTFIYAVIPQSLPVIASYSLLLFEGNIRHASILGIVGAGGIGFIIGKYMALFQYTRLMGAVILLIITVTIIDRISDYLRKQII
ncbi:MAG: phosphonate ABC transporter, permease protein PhnE, partial [Caldilineaceae bacterium]|nr:phosphonate ABC transporter, permease protein PhnE [Caldilineaceae bacterium]